MLYVHVVVTVKLDGAEGIRIPGLIRIGLTIGPRMIGFVVGTGLGLEPEPELEPDVGTAVGATATADGAEAAPSLLKRQRCLAQWHTRPTTSMYHLLEFG